MTNYNDNNNNNNDNNSTFNFLSELEKKLKIANLTRKILIVNETINNYNDSKSKFVSQQSIEQLEKNLFNLIHDKQLLLRDLK